MNRIDELDRSRSKILGCSARGIVMTLSPRSARPEQRDRIFSVVLKQISSYARTLISPARGEPRDEDEFINEVDLQRRRDLG
jgi:hypothetical protein